MLRKAASLAWLCFILLHLSSCAARHTHFMRQLDLKRLKAGTYVGSDSTLLCSVKLTTRIKDGRITEIKILKHFVTFPLAGRAYHLIPKRIIEKQSLDVDAVTAATVSSNNIKRAVFNALEKGFFRKEVKGDEKSKIKNQWFDYAHHDTQAKSKCQWFDSAHH